MTDEIEKQYLSTASRLSVAPMLDWSDRHCRFFHRQLSRGALLYTEMVTVPAILHGPRARLLGHDAAEQPLALQLGGADPRELAQAVRLAAPYGFSEMNLNCGCPSDRVQSGAFGAVLMRDPALVARCLAAMQEASPAEVTVKCRLGVDEQEPRETLPAFLEAVAGAGVRRVILHARKAWLQGLSPKENREIPPLDHALVFEMARAFPQFEFVLNGGVGSLAQVQDLLAQAPSGQAGAGQAGAGQAGAGQAGAGQAGAGQAGAGQAGAGQTGAGQGGLAGVMVGRAAYHEPVQVLAGADAALYGLPGGQTAESALAAMLPYIDRHLAAGGRLHQVSRHMLGLFAGRPGARAWRRRLSELAAEPGAGARELEAAAGAVLRVAA